MKNLKKVLARAYRFLTRSNLELLKLPFITGESPYEVWISRSMAAKIDLIRVYGSDGRYYVQLSSGGQYIGASQYTSKAGAQAARESLIQILTAWANYETVVLPLGEWQDTFVKKKVA